MVTKVINYEKRKEKTLLWKCLATCKIHISEKVPEEWKFLQECFYDLLLKSHRYSCERGILYSKYLRIIDKHQMMKPEIKDVPREELLVSSQTSLCDAGRNLWASLQMERTCSWLQGINVLSKRHNGDSE